MSGADTIYSASVDMISPTKSVQIGVVGRGMVGKTALIQKCKTDEFITEYTPTEYEVLSIETYVDDVPVKVDIGDAGGTPNNQVYIDKNINASQGFILVYDVTRKETFDALSEIRKHIMELKGLRANLPVVLIGNKIDLETYRVVETSRGISLAKRWNCPFYETSALNGANVREAFDEGMSEIEEKRLYPVREKTLKSLCCNIL